jgi:hypothetical protein
MKNINKKTKEQTMVLKGKTNQNDVYDNNRYLVNANGSIRSTNDWNGKDTKNHIYAPDLRTARAKARTLNLI